MSRVVAVSSGPVRKHDRQVVVRMPAELHGRLEAYAEGERKRTGYPVSIADVIRKLLGEALLAIPPERPRKHGRG